jgi:hypothetical protein
VTDLFEAEEFVIDIYDRTAGIAKDRIDPFFFKAFQHYSCAVHFHGVTS